MTIVSADARPAAALDDPSPLASFVEFVPPQAANVVAAQVTAAMRASERVLRTRGRASSK
jgi:hypothetical protein